MSQGIDHPNERPPAGQGCQCGSWASAGLLALFAVMACGCGAQVETGSDEPIVNARASPAAREPGSGESAEGTRVVRKKIGPLFPSPDQTTFDQEVVIPNPSDSKEATLKLVTRSCDCMDPSPGPIVIPPGETGVISISTHLMPLTEQRLVMAKYDTGLKEAPLLAVELLLNVYARVAFEPAELPSIALRAGEVQQFTFNVVAHHPAQERHAPLTVQSKGGRVRITTTRQQTAARGGVTREVYTCRGDLDAPQARDSSEYQESYSDTIIARCGKYEAQAALNWRCNWRVVARPPKLFFQLQDSARQEKTLSIEGDEPFSVNRVVPGASGLIVSNSAHDLQTPRRTHSLRILLEDSSDPVAIAFEESHLTLSLSHPRQQSLRIPVYIFRSAKGGDESDTIAEQIVPRSRK